MKKIHSFVQNMNKRFWFTGFAILIGVLALAGRSSATLLTYEDFFYNTGFTLDGDSGGIGWDANWGQFLGGATSHTVLSGSLVDPSGTLVTSGNHIMTTTNAGAYSGRFPFLPGYGTNTFYYSVLIRWDSSDANSSDDYFGLQIYNTPANASSDIFVGKGGASPFIHMETGGNTGNGGNIPAQSSDSSVTAAVGSTYFLVVRIDFANGPTTNPDTFKLYVNPLPGGTEPAVANATLSYNLGVQNGLALQSGNGAMVSYDEIRIGTTYADVTPSTGVVVPTPPTLSVRPSGANVIVSWPTSAGSTFNLYSRASASTGTFALVPIGAATVGSNYEVTVPASGGAQYFRLSNQ